MPPLHIEAFHSTNRNWFRLGEIHPTDPMASMSDNKPDGSRNIYMLKCARDDSGSTIFRSGAGVDTKVGRFREIIAMDTSKLEVVKELRDGESFEMDVKPDMSPASIKVRFTHKKGI